MTNTVTTQGDPVPDADRPVTAAEIEAVELDGLCALLRRVVFNGFAIETETEATNAQA